MGRIIPAPGGGEAAATASVDAIADQAGTGSFTAALTSSAVPSAHLWSVSGPAIIASETTAVPTITTYAGGEVAVLCLATINGVQVQATPRIVQIGTGYHSPVNPQPYDSVGIATV